MNTTPPVRQGWLKRMQLGQQYLKIWPQVKQLSPVFPENRVIKATRFGIRFMPPLAIFTLTWQIALNAQLGSAMATALFACSLPLQGLWWLGKRAATPLPERLLKWFYDIREKFAQAGIAMAPVENPPTYFALAELLKRAFKQLDNSFLDDI